MAKDPRFRKFWAIGNDRRDRNQPAPCIPRPGPLRLALSRNRHCSLCAGEKPSRSAYVVGGVSDYWLCDRCVKEAIRRLPESRGQTPLETKRLCSFCGQERGAEESSTEGELCVCAGCLGDMDFAFEHPVVPPG